MPNQEPLTILLQKAKLKILTDVTKTMRECGIPAVMMEGVLSGVLAEIRAQVSVDLITDYQNMSLKNLGDHHE